MPKSSFVGHKNCHPIGFPFPQNIYLPFFLLANKKQKTRLTPLHCKPSPFDKQFCMANTAIYTSNITFQGNQKKVFQPRQI
jgi:hypothetical protein